MARKNKQKFEIVAAYDTETTTIGKGEAARAFAYLYIFNDLRGVNLASYAPGTTPIIFKRTYVQVLETIDDFISYGKQKNVVPVICAYNLAFDLQTIIFELRKKYDMCVCAQSSTTIYTLDLLANDQKPILRFWDTWFLEPRGLAAMGKVAGVKKAVGDLDYSLVRHDETPLTDKELHYAARDVEVIPAYLRYLLETERWLTPDMFAVSVLTKTSIVRQMARHELYNLSFKKSNGKRCTIGRAFDLLCEQEQARTYEQYALRKACFRGGFCFTSAKNAHQVIENVASLDETSAHHAFINGRMLPVHFKSENAAPIIDNALALIKKLNLLKMSNWQKPIPIAFHGLIYFENLRLKKNSVFEKFEIGLAPESKFNSSIDETAFEDLRNAEAENILRAQGFHDSASADAVFAYGKLIQASSAFLFLNEGMIIYGIY